MSTTTKIQILAGGRISHMYISGKGYGVPRPIYQVLTCTTAAHIKEAFSDLRKCSEDEGLSEVWGWSHGDVAQLMKCTFEDGIETQKILDTFVVHTMCGKTLAKAEGLLLVLDSRANCYTREVASFKACMEEYDSMYAMERYGQSLGNAEGYSKVYSRILQAMKADEFKALSHADKLDRAHDMLENLKTVIGNIREYFMDGILRSSSASSTNQISNILENAKRDGILEALRDIRSL